MRNNANLKANTDLSVFAHYVTILTIVCFENLSQISGLYFHYIVVGQTPELLLALENLTVLFRLPCSGLCFLPISIITLVVFWLPSIK